MEVKHMSCLGALCEPLSEMRHVIIHKNKEEYMKTFTLNPLEVTCKKCIEILIKEQILEKDGTRKHI